MEMAGLCGFRDHVEIVRYHVCECLLCLLCGSTPREIAVSCGLNGANNGSMHLAIHVLTARHHPPTIVLLQDYEFNTNEK